MLLIKLELKGKRECTNAETMNFWLISGSLKTSVIKWKQQNLENEQKLRNSFESNIDKAAVRVRFTCMKDYINNSDFKQIQWYTAIFYNRNNTTLKAVDSKK